MQPDAAVRGGTAEAMDLVAAVDRIAAVEEDRVRHGRVVVFLREPRSFHALGSIGAAGGAVAGAAGGHHPAVARHAVDGDRHPLRALVDGDEDIGAAAAMHAIAGSFAAQFRCGKSSPYRASRFSPILT